MSRLARLGPRRLLHSLDEVERLHGKVHGLETRVRRLVAAHESTEKTVEQLRTALAAFPAPSHWQTPTFASSS